MVLGWGDMVDGFKMWASLTLLSSVSRALIARFVDVPFNPLDELMLITAGVGLVGILMHN